MAEVVPQSPRVRPGSHASAGLAGWRERIAGLPAVARSTKTILAVASSLRSEPITLRAAALSYLTVLSIVPLLTVVFSLVQAFLGPHEVENRLRDELLRNFVGGPHEIVAHAIDVYIQRASTIGGVGFALLIVSSVSLMANIEHAFNQTFRVTRPRSLAVRVVVYWCLLTLGPLLVAVSLAATAFLASQRMAAWFGPVRHLFFLAPLIVTYATFSLLYMIVPNTRVRRYPALLGAFVAGSAWEIAKVVYATLSQRSMHIAIYGPLSALPLFLVWVYLSWILVLFGARIAYAAQTSGAPGNLEPVRTPADREILAVQAMRVVAVLFQRGNPAPDADAIALELGAFGPDVAELLGSLQSAGLVRVVDEGGFVPARGLGGIRLADIRRVVRWGSGGPQAGDDAADAHRVRQAWRRAETASDEQLGMTLEDLARDSTLPG